MTTGRFELVRGGEGQFRFSLKVDSGTLLSSELYKAKASAENGIASVRTNASADGRYELRVSSHGKHYFNLKASNGQVIASSPMHASPEDRDRAVLTVKSLAGLAEMRDLT